MSIARDIATPGAALGGRRAQYAVGTPRLSPRLTTPLTPRIGRPVPRAPSSHGPQPV